MSITSEQNVQDDQASAHRDARVGQIEHREAADLEEVEDESVQEPIDQVPDGPGENDRHPHPRQDPTKATEQKERQQDQRDNPGDGEKQLSVYVDGSATPVLGPFELSDFGIQFTYYDVDDIPNSADSLVRYVQMIMEFEYDTYRDDIDKRFIRHRIQIWKYFKNLYL